MEKRNEINQNTFHREQMISKKILIRTAFWIMVATLGSRILGFLREVQLAYYFGLSDMRAAFTVAFKIPNLIRTLVADSAISAAFIPIFTGLLLKEDRKEAWKIGSQILNLTFLFLSIIVIVCEIFMPTLIFLTTPGFSKDPDLFAHTVSLSRIIFPTIVLLGIGGIFVGILHSMNHFTLPAIAPIFWNMVNLSFVFYFYRTLGIYAAAWGLLLATCLQLLIQYIPFFKLDWKYSFDFSFSHPAVQQVGSLLIPVTLSIGIINFNALINNLFASLLGPSQVAAIDSAFRLFQLPQGLFAIAIGTVLFPTLSVLIFSNDHLRFSKTLETGIRQIFYITLPFTGWFMILALPISKLCFERGQFSPQDSQMVAWALIFYSIGLAFTSANTLLNRGFYSLKKTWLPLYVGIINMAMNAVLSWILMTPLGHGGICLSTSIVSIFNFFALCYLMKRETKEFKITPIILSLLQISLLSAILSGSAFIVYNFFIVETLWDQIISLFFAVLGSSLVYLLLSTLFKLKELKEALILFKMEKKE